MLTLSALEIDLSGGTSTTLHDRSITMLAMFVFSDLSIQTELLILAHECFTVACSMEGISNVLKAARISTDVLVASQEFSLMVKHLPLLSLKHL